MSVGKMRFAIGIGLLAATLSAALPVSQARGGWLRTPARIFAGNATTAYRDPAALWADGVCHLFFTLVETERDGCVYSYVAMSTSRDLLHWTPVTKLTPRCDRDYSSPGNVVRDGDEWLLCFQSYPRPGNRNDGKVRYADQTARLFVMRSKDLVRWSKPELLRVKGPSVAEADMGRMIDPYLVQDPKGGWMCFYKQNGASFSRSPDLKTWEYVGKTDAGENVCVVSEGGRFLMMHSPQNGMRFKESTDLLSWRDLPGEITLGQKEWPWARGRLTAGFLFDGRTVAGVGGWVLFFHASGPRTESEGDFDRNASIGVVVAESISDFLDR
jgi:sucrose-6-phosphate hydrolase SacC (GH32 family)